MPALRAVNDPVGASFVSGNWPFSTVYQALSQSCMVWGVVSVRARGAFVSLSLKRSWQALWAVRQYLDLAVAHQPPRGLQLVQRVQAVKEMTNVGRNEQVRGWQRYTGSLALSFRRTPPSTMLKLTRIHGTTGLNKREKTRWVNLSLLREGRRMRENTIGSIQWIDLVTGQTELTEEHFPTSKSGWIYNNQFFITVTIGSVDRKHEIVGKLIQYYRFDDLLEILLLAKEHSKLSWDP